MKTWLIAALTLVTACSATFVSPVLRLALPHLYHNVITQTKPVTYVVQTAPAFQILKANDVQLDNATSVVTTKLSAAPLAFHTLAFQPQANGIFDPYRRLFYTFQPVVFHQVQTTKDKNAEGEKDNEKPQPASASEEGETTTETAKEIEGEA